jgi:thioredoxin 1
MAGNVRDITDASFDEDVLKSELPVLVDFWAPWCGPCKLLAPTVDALAGDYSDKLRVVKVNTDDNRQAAISYRVESLPTLMLFKGGEPVERIIGLQPKERLTATLERHLGS